MLDIVIKYTAMELSVQPYLRGIVKKTLYEHGQISTSPTEEGMKVLDVFHPSYRVKRIKEKKIYELSADSMLGSDRGDGDLFLDILENEKKGLIKLSINITDYNLNTIIKDFVERFTSPNLS